MLIGLRTADFRTVGLRTPVVCTVGFRTPVYKYRDDGSTSEQPQPVGPDPAEATRNTEKVTSWRVEAHRLGHVLLLLSKFNVRKTNYRGTPGADPGIAQQGRRAGCQTEVCH